MFDIQSFDGGRVDLSGLTQITGPLGGGLSARGIEVVADGADSRVELSALDQFVDDGVVPNSSIKQTGGGLILLPNLTTARGVSLMVDGGMTLSLPMLGTYTHGGNDASAKYLQASGLGSILAMPLLTTITGGTRTATHLYVQAISGGRVEAGNLTQITLPQGNQSNDRSVRVWADGAASVVDLPGLEDFVDQYGVSSIQAVNSGTVTLATLAASLSDIDVTTDESGTIYVGSLNLDVASTLSGRGTIIGNVENAGQVNPGASAGTLTIDGDYTQTADGVLNIELGGTATPGTDFD